LRAPRPPADAGAGGVLVAPPRGDDGPRDRGHDADVGADGQAEDRPRGAAAGVDPRSRRGRDGGGMTPTPMFTKMKLSRLVRATRAATPDADVAWARLAN